MNDERDMQTELEIEPPYFGGCPECGQDDGYLNVGADHWFVCHAHGTCWWAGANLFSSWREETRDDWEANARQLNDYQKVQPLLEHIIVGRDKVANDRKKGHTREADRTVSRVRRN